MIRFFLFLFIFLTVFSSCSFKAENLVTEQPEKAIVQPEEAQDIETVDDEYSFVQQLALDKAKEIGMLDYSPEEAIKRAYDYLIENVYFADPVGLDSWRYLSDTTEAIGFIENRSLSPLLYNIGSCEDFAAVLKMLLETSGLEAKYVAGYTLSKDQVYIDHAWTMVNLGGNWYHLDPQLEQNIVRDGMIRYRFFMKTDEQMASDHKWSENLVDYWPRTPQQEKDNILDNYVYPLCRTEYGTPSPKKIVLPTRPDFQVIDKELTELRKSKELPPLTLDVEPPILVAEKHITPPLTSTPAETSHYGKSFLSVPEKAFYDRIYSKLKEQYIGAIPTIPQLSQNELKNVVRQITNDNPEIYWAEISIGENGDAEIDYKPDYNEDRINKEKAALENLVREFAAPLENLSDYEKTIAIHDYICESTSYRYGPENDNPYGALINKSAYCSGYSRAFQYLANSLGLENIFVAGWDKESTTHAWNAVKMDGDWYYIDTTWDRASNSYGGAYHDFFAMTSDECFISRQWDNTQYPGLPEADATDYNFYIKNEYTITAAQTEELGQQIKDIAAIANQQLMKKDNLKSDYSYSFAEFKVVSDRNDYLKTKNFITKELFTILKEMQKQGEEENLGFSVSYDTEVSCYYNDNMQIVAFYPKAKNN